MYVPNLRHCWICGSEYKYCEKCDPLHSWKTMACTRSHYQIVMIIDEYRNGVINVKEATEKFKNIGITLDSNFSEYLPEVAELIKKIISEGTIITVNKPKLEKNTNSTKYSKH